jgi:hypothetical protein
MATNTLLTPLMITRKALQILHAKMNFIGNINRQYDNSFAQSGAKIGDSLRIRLPNQYTVRTGAPLQVQDTIETSVTLKIDKQKGVDTQFSSAELTLSLDDFADRILEPAMAVLAASVESDALSMMADIPASVGTAGTPIVDLLPYLQAKAILDMNLAPPSPRITMITPMMEASIVNALKGLFQDSTSIANQYKEGIMGRTAGSDWVSNTLIGPQAAGTAVLTTIAVTGANQTGGSLILGGFTAGDTLKRGQSFTIPGVFALKPESLTPTTVLKTFSVAGDFTAGSATGTVNITPEIIATGPYRNVSNVPADTSILTFAATTGAGSQQGMLFHKDAFTFATADLVMPKGVDFAAREVMDGISMRIVRAYDINSDAFPCRIDVLYGYKTLRNSQAVRIFG